MRNFFPFFVIICALSCTPDSHNSDTEYISNSTDTRTLYLIRHSKSSHSDSSKIDFDRLLLKKGKEDASLMGEKLMQRGVILDKIIISPSKRTKTTAKRIAKKLNFEKDSIQHDTILYLCKTNEYISVIKNINPNFKSVAIIGHNPSTIQVANHFQKDTIFTSVPTTGIIAIEFKSDSWFTIGHKQGKFLFFDCPKNYKHEF
ncbi:MAG: histidine phosphatase family protein [Saprospiraceae bacterium]|nr:histidine phosphatase family protein [Saprospiraceae bacterium]